MERAKIIMFNDSIRLHLPCPFNMISILTLPFLGGKILSNLNDYRATWRCSACLTVHRNDDPRSEEPFCPSCSRFETQLKGPERFLSENHLMTYRAVIRLSGVVLGILFGILVMLKMALVWINDKLRVVLLYCTPAHLSNRRTTMALSSVLDFGDSGAIIDAAASRSNQANLFNLVYNFDLEETESSMGSS